MGTVVRAKRRAPSREQPDPSMEAWRRLIEDTDGIGPSRLHAVVFLDPECGDETCFYYDPDVGGCSLFGAGIPWSRGVCRMRTPQTTWGGEMEMTGSRVGTQRSRGGKLGVPAAKLGDADLEREMRHLWRTREEAILHGGPHAIRAHTDRMLELEHEYVARFPFETTPSPSRTRRGSRLMTLQPVERGRGRAGRSRKRTPVNGAKR